jgi:hypothetical protein
VASGVFAQEGSWRVAERVSVASDGTQANRSSNLFAACK